MPTVKREEEQKGVDTIFGKDTQFEGKLAFDGEVRIAGKFKGDINAKGTLYVEDTAKISAEVSIGILVVHGEIIGNVKANQAIEIKPTGRIIGNIETKSLFIERGAVLEGNCKMDKVETIRPIQLLNPIPT